MTAEMVDLATGEILPASTTLAALDPAEIDKAADPGAFVVLCLERSKTWLTEALEQGDISSIVEMKSQAEAIRVYTVQKQLGKDSELAATEIVRRAERGLALAVRDGQESGRIAKHGQAIHYRGNGLVVDHTDIQSVSEATGMSRDALASTYPLADAVTAEEFEAAVEEAKAEGDLSRANLVRKVKGEGPPKPADRPEHLRRMRRHDANRIVEQTVIGLEGYVLGISLIDFEQLDPSRIEGWSRSLSTSLQSLNRLSRQLKELNQP